VHAPAHDYLGTTFQLGDLLGAKNTACEFFSEQELASLPKTVFPFRRDRAKQSIAKHIGMPIPEFNKKTVIGTIAELHPNKGLPYLINAFTSVVMQYPQTALIIIGDGQDQPALHLLIKEKKLEQSVFLAGYMDHAAEYLKAFKEFFELYLIGFRFNMKNNPFCPKASEEFKLSMSIFDHQIKLTRRFKRSFSKSFP
jgi:glycosyltransferase involved in cell wall biosynthesis